MVKNTKTHSYQPGQTKRSSEVTLNLLRQTLISDYLEAEAFVFEDDEDDEDAGEWGGIVTCVW